MSGRVLEMAPVQRAREAKCIAKKAVRAHRRKAAAKLDANSCKHHPTAKLIVPTRPEPSTGIDYVYGLTGRRETVLSRLRRLLGK